MVDPSGAPAEENPQSYFVGVDGSDASEDAFQVIMNGLRRKEDKLTVANIHDSRKDFLPFNLKPNYIREIYKCKLMVIGDKGKFVSKEFTGGSEDKTTKTELWNLAMEDNASIIVTGMHGRKGPKA